ncbi:MAG: long-chain fatty acid--CoA ligase, partial [Desulfobacula sp.]|nr:long-chain fatty acid--CoA ligase [Desulfobacula sp.]
YGDKEDFVSCLINIDPVVVGKWAEDRGISYSTYMDLSSKDEVYELIMEQILDVNSRAEKEHFKIERFALLYKLLDVDDGELTKTGKIRRKFVQERYQNLYDSLFNKSVDEQKVEASFTYQDGQSTSVKTTIKFFTVKGA